jgi:DNA-damage-inducible protein D
MREKKADHTDTPVETIQDGAIERLIARFEDTAQSENGTEFWYARDLQGLLGYDRWENFSKVVEKAKKSCESTGYEIQDHFRDITKVIEVGKGARLPLSDAQLTRYACYLVAQNGDARKKPVAFAQTYFAIQTRKQEVSDENGISSTPLSEDQKRILLRDEIRAHNKKLASAARGAGVTEPVDFAVFQNFGYKGLYGGLDKQGIQSFKKIESKANILDYMGSTELAANLFRATQAEEKLKRENIKGKDNANRAHFEVGQKVRQAIKDIGGAMPEDLPSAENLAKVSRRVQKSLKQHCE